MLNHLSRRLAGASIAAVLSISVAAPVFSDAVLAAPMPVSGVISDANLNVGHDATATQVRYRRRSGAVAGGAVALGLLGLGAAAIASQQRRDRYYDGYDNRGYYGNRGFYDRGYPNSYGPGGGFYDGGNGYYNDYPRRRIFNGR